MMAKKAARRKKSKSSAKRGRKAAGGSRSRARSAKKRSRSGTRGAKKRSRSGARGAKKKATTRSRPRRSSAQTRYERAQAVSPDVAHEGPGQSETEDSVELDSESLEDRETPARGLSIDPEVLGERYLRNATNPDAPPESNLVNEENEERSDSEVNLLSNTIREGSLFDQPTQVGTRAPSIHADESEQPEESEARDEALRNTREVLQHGRAQAEKRGNR